MSRNKGHLNQLYFRGVSLFHLLKSEQEDRCSYTA